MWKHSWPYVNKNNTFFSSDFLPFFLNGNLTRPFIVSGLSCKDSSSTLITSEGLAWTFFAFLGFTSLCLETKSEKYLILKVDKKAKKDYILCKLLNFKMRNDSCRLWTEVEPPIGDNWICIVPLINYDITCNVRYIF